MTANSANIWSSGHKDNCHKSNSVFVLFKPQWKFKVKKLVCSLHDSVRGRENTVHNLPQSKEKTWRINCKSKQTPKGTKRTKGCYKLWTEGSHLKNGGGYFCRDLRGIGVNKTQKRHNQTLREKDLFRNHHRKRHLQIALVKKDIWSPSWWMRCSMPASLLLD